jgi:hypothetical protein
LSLLQAFAVILDAVGLVASEAVLELKVPAERYWSIVSSQNMFWMILRYLELWRSRALGAPLDSCSSTSKPSYAPDVHINARTCIKHAMLDAILNIIASGKRGSDLHAQAFLSREDLPLHITPAHLRRPGT